MCKGCVPLTSVNKGYLEQSLQLGRDFVAVLCTLSISESSPNILQTLAKIPYLDIIVSSLAYLMTILIPLSMLSGLIRLILRMPSDAAMLTARFVKSRRSVRQAL